MLAAAFALAPVPAATRTQPTTTTATPSILLALSPSGLWVAAVILVAAVVRGWGRCGSSSRWSSG